MIAHPSPDLYGSDLQLVESVRGLRAAGWHVSVCLPVAGPLVERLTAEGATVLIVVAPVLRRSLMRPAAFARMLVGLPAALLRMRRAMRGADVVYVNTITQPWWLLAARLTRRPALCHVHEAEQADSRLVRFVLYAPVVLAASVIANSQVTAAVVGAAVRRLRRRTVVVLNGVAESEPSGLEPEPGRIALVTRLSPRKGVDVALDAVAILRDQGRDVFLEICGTPFAGYEWFEAQLRARAELDDLAGAVHFAGYVTPTRPVLDRASVVIAPSLGESFGNTAVEAQLAGRPLVASDVQGLAEIVRDGSTGILVRPADAAALAAGVALVLDSSELATALGEAGQADARSRFGVDRYRREIAAVVGELSRRVT